MGGFLSTWGLPFRPALYITVLRQSQATDLLDEERPSPRRGGFARRRTLQGNHFWQVIQIYRLLDDLDVSTPILPTVWWFTTSPERTPVPTTAWPRTSGRGGPPARSFEFEKRQVCWLHPVWFMLDRLGLKVETLYTFVCYIYVYLHLQSEIMSKILVVPYKPYCVYANSWAHLRLTFYFKSLAFSLACLSNFCTSALPYMMKTMAGMM